MTPSKKKKDFEKMYSPGSRLAPKSPDRVNLILGALVDRAGAFDELAFDAKFLLSHASPASKDSADRVACPPFKLFIFLVFNFKRALLWGVFAGHGLAALSAGGHIRHNPGAFDQMLNFPMSASDVPIVLRAD